MAVIDLPTLLEPIGVTLPTDMETMVVINCQPYELHDRIALAVATSPKHWIGAPKPVEDLEESPIFMSLSNWVQNAPHLLIPLLMPVMTDAQHAAVHQEALRQNALESILKIMLQVDAIQLDIAHFMNAILLDCFHPFANHPRPTFTLPDLHVMCINQLRYLDHVCDPAAFAVIMIKALRDAEPHIRADLLVALAEIIPPSAHELVVQLILEKPTEYLQGDLLGASIECLTHARVPERLLPEMIRQVAALLPGIKEDKVPLVVRFLLSHTGTGQSSTYSTAAASASAAKSLQRAMFVRPPAADASTAGQTGLTQRQLTQHQAPPPLDPAKECLDMFALSGMDPTSIALTMDEFIDGMKHKSVLQTVVEWLQTKCAAGAGGDTDTEIEPLADREWVLLVAIGCVPHVGEKKMREVVFANIKAGRLTPAVVSRLMVRHTAAFESKHTVLLKLVETLVSPSLASFLGGFGGFASSSAGASSGGSSRAPKAAALVSAGTAPSTSAQESVASGNVLSMLNPPAHASPPTAAMAVGAQLLYSGIAHLTIAPRQDWVAKCVELIGRGGPHALAQTELALRVLFAVAASPRAIATQLEPFVVFIRNVLEGLTAMSLHHVSLYFDIMARVGFATASTLETVASPLISDLDVLAGKFLGSTQARPNAMGVLAALAMVERYADPNAPWMLPLPAQAAGQEVSEEQVDWHLHQQQAAVQEAKRRLSTVLLGAKVKPAMLAVTFERLANVISGGGLHPAVIESLFLDREEMVGFCLQQDSSDAATSSAAAAAAAHAAGLVFAVTIGPSGDAVVVDSVAPQVQSSASASASSSSASTNQLFVDVDMLTSETGNDDDPNHRLYFTSDFCEAVPSLIRCFHAIADRDSTDETLAFVDDLATRSIHFSLAHGRTVLAHLRVVCNMFAARTKNGDPVALDRLLAYMKKIKAVEEFLFAQHEEQCALYEKAQAKNKELQAVAASQAAAGKKSKGKSKGSGDSEPPKKRGRPAKAGADGADAEESGPAAWLPAVRAQWPLLPVVYTAMARIPIADRQLFHYMLVDFYDWMLSPRRAESSATVLVDPTDAGNKEPMVIQMAATECPLPVHVATDLASCWFTWLIRLTQARDNGGLEEVKDEPKEGADSFMGGDGDTTMDSISSSSTSRRGSIGAAPGEAAAVKKAEKKAAGGGGRKRSSLTSASKPMADTVELIVASLLRLFMLTDNVGMLDAIATRLSNTARLEMMMAAADGGDEMDVDKSIDLGLSMQPGPPLLPRGIEHMDVDHDHRGFPASQPNLESDEVILELMGVLIGFVTTWTPAAAVLLYQIMVRLTTMHNNDHEHDHGMPDSSAVPKNSKRGAGKAGGRSKCAALEVPERFHNKLHTVASTFLSHKWAGYEQKSNHDAIEYFVDAQIKYSEDPVKTLQDIVSSLVYVAKAGEDQDDDENEDAPSTQAQDLTALLTKHTIPPYFKTALRQCSTLLAQVKFEGDDEQFATELKTIGSLCEQVMDVTTTQGEGFVRATIIEGAKFIATFNSHIAPTLFDLFPANPEIYNPVLRKLQKGSKILQRVCGHAKILAKASLVAPVPKARRALKEFANTLYQLNIAGGLGDIVETGTSKHRTIDGAPASTQVYRASQSAAESHDEAEYDPKADSARAKKSAAKGKAKAKPATAKEAALPSPVASPAKPKVKPGPASRKRARSEVDAHDHEEGEDGNASSSSASSRTSAGSATRPSTKRMHVMAPRSSAERQAAQARAASGLGSSDEDDDEDDLERTDDDDAFPINTDELEGGSDTDDGSDDEESSVSVLTQVEAKAGARMGGKPVKTRAAPSSTSSSMARARSARMPPPSSTQRVAGAGGGLHRSGSRGTFKVPMRSSAAASRGPATKTNPKSAKYVRESDEDEDQEEEEDGLDQDELDDRDDGDD